MSIFHKATVSNYLQELDSHYAVLKKALEGKPLDRHEMQILNYDPDSANPPSLVRINVDDVLDAVGFFKVAVDNIRRINSRAVKKT